MSQISKHRLIATHVKQEHRGRYPNGDPASSGRPAREHSITFAKVVFSIN